MKKVKVKINLGDIQDKIWGEIVQDFSIQDLENAKQEWIENLIEIGAKQVGDEALLNDLCNFLNNIEFEEKTENTTINIALGNYKELELTRDELDILYTNYIYKTIPDNYYRKRNVSIPEGLELYKSEFSILNFIEKIENRELTILKGNDIEELMIKYAFKGKEKESLVSATYDYDDIHDILKEYKKILENKEVEILKSNDGKHLFIMECDEKWKRF